MSEMFNPHAPATAYDHNTTIVAVLELSGKNWLFGAVAPGLSRRTNEASRRATSRRLFGRSSR
jgi:hypothetical protein